MVIVVAVMPGADAVLVPELLPPLVPQAASNPARQTIAISLIRKALPPITLFNRSSFLYAGSQVRRLGISCGIVPIHHPLLPTSRGLSPASPADCKNSPKCALDTVRSHEHGDHEDAAVNRERQVVGDRTRKAQPAGHPAGQQRDEDQHEGTPHRAGKTSHSPDHDPGQPLDRQAEGESGGPRDSPPESQTPTCQPPPAT